MSDPTTITQHTPAPSTTSEKKLRHSGHRLSKRLLRRHMYRGQRPVATLDHVNVDGVVSRMLEQYQGVSTPRAVEMEDAHMKCAMPIRGGGSSGVKQDVMELLDQSLEELRIQVAFMAGMCADGARGVQLRTPESWAGEFLDLIEDHDTPQDFFTEAHTSPYAAGGAACQALVQLAAAYAWKLHLQNPEFAVPGSLRHSLRNLDRAQNEAWARHTANYQHHSYAVEGQELSQSHLQDSLRQLFQQS